MKKYVKPSIEVISLKSSEEIAVVSYKQLQDQIIDSYIAANSKKYMVTQYSLKNSNLQTQ